MKNLDAPICQTGTITFKLRTDKAYCNGQGQADYSQLLVKLPGINQINFRRVDEVVNVSLTWESGSGPVVHDIIVDFPDSFVAEWEFQPLSHYGLAIVFFAAKGEKGEDIFDPELPPRDGNFGHYIKGAITSYHVSYFANVREYQMGRTDSNLRKNNRFYRVGGGPVAIEPGANGWQHIRLIKDINHIQLSANGRTFVDWTDDKPERYGEPRGGGKIGLRQMTPTIGAYRNFRVWELQDKEVDHSRKD